ncbi:Crp/Fnr family transcriptional regulator [Gillisia limnaea]|uniref:Transcriptional regulator, Crp/Fnr family n=2 Tax=Gillisia TaxID=244698 RepID=H2BZ54_GILLR|nr:transcriptional regulator, Crp/Fnr family [Gillisia limnaea DSM 15749]
MLDGCDFLKEMDKESSNSFLSLFKEENWSKNTCILNHEKLNYKFHIILSGRVKMYQVDPFTGKELTLFLLIKGDVFDIFCLLDEQEHTVYYECLDDVTVLSTPMPKLRSWLKNNPKNYKILLPYAGKQLRMLENSVSDMTFTNISTRLLKLLIRNVNANSRDLELIDDLPNKEIANLLGSTRAVINRHLQKLKKKGSIRLSRNRMEIKDLGILIHLLECQKKIMNEK